MTWLIKPRCDSSTFSDASLLVVMGTKKLFPLFLVINVSYRLIVNGCVLSPMHLQNKRRYNKIQYNLSSPFLSSVLVHSSSPCQSIPPLRVSPFLLSVSVHSSPQCQPIPPLHVSPFLPSVSVQVMLYSHLYYLSSILQG